jgi:hypothetical protein
MPSPTILDVCFVAKHQNLCAPDVGVPICLASLAWGSCLAKNDRNSTAVGAAMEEVMEHKLTGEGQNILVEACSEQPPDSDEY